MIDYKKNFNAAYQQLNEAQKAAVHEVDGPVMVVAGPGTGKTQLLAARIGYILSQPDISAHNILCMTYTDAGVIAMRKRLLEFIGPEAYNVNIYTYHSFCNQVIQDNLEQFGGFLDLNKLTDLERVDLFVNLIDSFNDKHLLKKYKGDVYFDRIRLSNLFRVMKEESWNAKKVEDAVALLPELLANDENYIYKRATTRNGKRYEKGDVNESKIATEVKKYEKLVAAAKEFINYQAIIEKMKRYDYQDMILWCLAAFREDEDLLLHYQERYQYILVDEYQDTNGSQNELIYLLSSYWDRPNLFVVGDDDQSIFRFQGANMDNIVDFKNRFEPKTIVLEENYRSGQLILDKATALINQNLERLAATEKDISKNLIESREVKLPATINFTKYHNVVHEEKGIINQILADKEAGVDLSKIAIIYRKHKDVENIIKFLEINDVPLNVKRKIDVLQLPAVQQLISMLSYLHAELEKPYSADYRLFEILHFSYFELSPKEIAKISLGLVKESRASFSELTPEQKEHDISGGDRMKWRDVVSDAEWLEKHGVLEAEKITEISRLLESWIQLVSNTTIQVLLEKIVTESTMLDDILRGENSTFLLQVLNSFFEFVKSEATLNPRFDLKILIETLEKMEHNKLMIPFHKIIHSKSGVNFITAHSAKGLEFDKVYIIRCEQNNWVEKRSRNTEFKFPPSLVNASSQSDIEDDRRLFFVAMTRAKNALHISYPLADENGKEKEAVCFIHEIIDDKEEITEKSLNDEEIALYKSDLMRFRAGKVQLIDHDLIDLVLKDYVMSVTNLNKYIKCPVSFYFEVILRVPQARSSYLGFGNAIHISLYKFFTSIEKSPKREIPSVEELIQLYSGSLEFYRQHFTEKQFLNHLTLGKNVLTKYYTVNVDSWTLPRKYELEYKVRNVQHAGIPIKGDLDKIVYQDDHFYVVDYKTGKWKTDKFREPVGDEKPGDYWRQIVFYKMLIDADPHFTRTMSYGVLDFVEPDDKDKYRSKKIEVSSYDLEVVSKELVDTYNSIQNHEFEKGCEEQDCRWCNFVADHVNAGE